MEKVRSEYVVQLGQMDMWGPYPKGRQGYTHIFALVDAYNQYIVDYRCVNEPGELPGLIKRALDEFQSYGITSTNNDLERVFSRAKFIMRPHRKPMKS